MASDTAVAAIVRELKDYYDTTYGVNACDETILNESTETFEEIVDICKKNFHRQANAYWKERSIHDEKMFRAQEFAKRELTERKEINKFKRIQNTSSFSSGTYLIGESDVDITVFEAELETVKWYNSVLTPLGYTYKKTICEDLPEAYHVFSKYIDDVEIELKIRKKEPSKYISQLHKYTDEKMPQEKKIYFTYVKYLLKEDKQSYKMAKYSFYNSALHATSCTRALPMI